MTLNQHAINHMIVALHQEMRPQRGKRNADADTLFIGGVSPTEADQARLGDFGISKNYNVIFSAFDPADAGSGPTEFHVVVLAGGGQAFALPSGRLWKGSRQDAAVLLFPSIHAMLRFDMKGRLVVRGMNGRFNDEGYAMAHEALLAGASRRPGKVPVVSSIRGMPAVLDIATMADAFAAAA